MKLLFLSRWLWGGEPEYTAMGGGAWGAPDLGPGRLTWGLGGRRHSELSLQTDLPSP